MSKVEWKNLSPNTSRSDIASTNTNGQQTLYQKICASAPTSANVRRRKSNLRISPHASSSSRLETSSSNIIPRDCITWQIISQQLSLQLEQKYRAKMTASYGRVILSDEEHSDHVTVLTDNSHDLKVPSTAVEGKSYDL
jgi:K+-sensing histidine kinase KdpD